MGKEEDKIVPYKIQPQLSLFDTQSLIMDRNFIYSYTDADGSIDKRSFVSSLKLYPFICIIDSNSYGAIAR